MVENVRFGVLSADITSDAVLGFCLGEVSTRLETRCAVYSAGSDNVVLNPQFTGWESRNCHNCLPLQGNDYSEALICPSKDYRPHQIRGFIFRSLLVKMSGFTYLARGGSVLVVADQKVGVDCIGRGVGAIMICGCECRHRLDGARLHTRCL
jgi:hypothetical protein